MTYHTVAFNEHGARMAEARLSCHPRLPYYDAVEVRDASVRLVEAESRTPREAGSLKLGLLTWRCFRIYARRSADGIAAIVMHDDGRAMLAVSTMPEPTRERIANITRSFLLEASEVLDAQALVKQMQAGITDDHA